MNQPAVTLILCSRNDRYMGDSVWRLGTSLNYLANRVAELHVEDQVEVIVTDWGSEVPLGDAVQLSTAAADLVSFLHVTPAVAATRQGDSPFPEVIALNAAARRARGTLIGRIDQDTLVGSRALAAILGLPQDRLFFSNHRRVPFGLASLCPPLTHVETFVRWFGRRLQNDHTNPRAAYYSAGVGIWLVPRAIWHECGGYDERMIYMNSMETQMIARLTTKYELVNLGPLVNHDFYHLEHYPPGAIRKSSTHRKTNARHAPVGASLFHPNDAGWGMADTPLSLSRAPHQVESPAAVPSTTAWVGFLVFRVAPRLVRDALVRNYSAGMRGAASRTLRWRERLHRVARVLRTEPASQWASALRRPRTR